MCGQDKLTKPLGGISQIFVLTQLKSSNPFPHPTQATDDDRSLKKVSNFNPRPRKKETEPCECRAGVGFSEPAHVNLCGRALIGFNCRFLSGCTHGAARVI